MYKCTYATILCEIFVLLSHFSAELCMKFTFRLESTLLVMFPKGIRRCGIADDLPVGGFFGDECRIMDFLLPISTAVSSKNDGNPCSNFKVASNSLFSLAKILFKTKSA